MTPLVVAVKPIPAAMQEIYRSFVRSPGSIAVRLADGRVAMMFPA